MSTKRKGRKKVNNDKEKIRRKLRRIKRKGSCNICGENHPSCLEFHHKDSTIKNGEISSMISKYTEKEIMAELENCIIVCANCHRKIHWEETHGSKN